MVKEILLIQHNHFDPTWRRCFDRPAVFRGVTVRSYAEVEARCIEAWLKLAPRGYTFSEGQAVVLRTYLARRPRRAAVLRRMARTGRLNVMLAGETVQDTVLSTAEGLVRNFLTAAPFYAELVGPRHAAQKIAWLEDAFGNSPNYPQVLRGVGADAAARLSYRACPEPVWVGIDGTKIACMDHYPAAFAGSWAKHPPCPECRGTGCASCGRTGMVFVDGFDMAAVREQLAAGLEKHADRPWMALKIGSEEVLPDRRVADFLDEWNREHPRGPRMRWANYDEIYRRQRPELERALRARDDRPSADLNPAMPGCMVTRIRCKQRSRAVAYHLTAAESALACVAWEAGRPARPPEDLAEAWRRVAFSQFHDAITGTHIDSANRELMAMLDEAERIARRHLPLRRPRAPGRLKPLGGPGPFSLRLGLLDVTFDRRGILSVLSEGRDVFGEGAAPFNNLRRRYRIAELVLEPDFGDAWGTRISPAIGGNASGDFSLVFLGDYHTRVEASPSAVRWTGVYSGGDWKVKRLAWTVTAAPSADGRRLDFVTAVDWDTGSRRIRVLVPVRSQEATATYEVPFGHIDRTFDTSQMDYSQWNANQLEFPTLHWVRKAVDSQSGVALLNKGLPCNRWMPGRLDLSLVRSPEWAFCIVEPCSYEFWDTDGQRDAGRHLFEYSLLPYYDGLGLGELTRIGYEYNRPAPVAPPFAVEGDIVVTAWKLAESGKGWVLRLQEAGGKGTIARLDFGSTRSVAVTNLLEVPQGRPVRTRCYDAPIRPHGILTLLIR